MTLYSSILCRTKLPKHKLLPFLDTTTSNPDTFFSLAMMTFAINKTNYYG